MTLCRWIPIVATAFAMGQEAQPFTPEPASPWQPAWAVRARYDQLTEPEYPAFGFHRTGLELKLRWEGEWGPVRGEVGTRSALGSDANRLNGPRWDQAPSNGTQLDVASVAWSGAWAWGFGAVRAGLQENPLLAPQAMWSRELRATGLSGSVGLRSAGGLVQEAGLRAVAGRVRTLLGGDMDLRAAQGVLKLDTGAWSWTAYAGQWRLDWDGGGHRNLALPGQAPAARQHLVVANIGTGALWNGPLPLEARWSGCRNAERHETSEELQFTAGSRERVWWPQVSWTWQRLSSTGTLYPVNGDEWWFYRAARGARLEAALALPGRWVAAVSYLRQREDGESYQVRRTMVTLNKRF